MPRLLASLVPAIAALLGLACSLSATAQQTQGADPDAVLLVAKPSLRDANFAQTVILASRRDNGSAIGIILNRPTRQTMSRLFPEHEPSKKVADPIFFGGPVSRSAVFALVRLKENPGQGALPLMSDLYLCMNVSLVDKIIEDHPDKARFYVGYTGWAPGQLLNEVSRGGWHVMNVEEEILFRKDTQNLWEELVKRASRITASNDRDGRLFPAGLQLLN